MPDLTSIPSRSIKYKGGAMHAFGGFPYLVTKVIPAHHHIILLPPVGEDLLVHLARTQWEYNRLPTCLCLDWEASVFVNGDDSVSPANGLPYASFTLAGHIHPHPLLPQLPGSDARASQLVEWLATVGCPPERAIGHAMGDPLKGGREASADELEFMAGNGATGAPFGLWACPACGDYRGSCLDPSPSLAGIVVPVICRCVNQTRCAACGEPFYRRQLNTNHYDPADDRVWHLSGLAALEHQCPWSSP